MHCAYLTLDITQAAYAKLFRRFYNTIYAPLYAERKDKESCTDIIVRAKRLKSDGLSYTVVLAIDVEGQPIATATGVCFAEDNVYILDYFITSEKYKGKRAIKELLQRFFASTTTAGKVPICFTTTLTADTTLINVMQQLGFRVLRLSNHENSCCDAIHANEPFEFILYSDNTAAITRETFGLYLGDYLSVIGYTGDEVQNLMAYYTVLDSADNVVPLTLL